MRVIDVLTIESRNASTSSKRWDVEGLKQAINVQTIPDDLSQRVSRSRWCQWD